MNIRTGVHPVLSVVEAMVETTGLRPEEHLAEISMWDPIMCLEGHHCKSKS